MENVVLTTSLFLILQGLLARGDMRGGNVEKDDQLVPRIKLEQEPMTRRSSRSYSTMHSRSLDHLDTISRPPHVSPISPNHVTDHLTETDVGKKTLKGTSLSPSVLRSLTSGSTENIPALLPRDGLRNENTYSSQVAHSHSGNFTSHSGSYHSSLVPSKSFGSVSRSSNPVMYPNVPVPYGAPGSLPSLGYVSNDSINMDPHGMSHTHRHTPYASYSTNIGMSHMELESLSKEFSDQDISGALSRSSFSRPSSLSLVGGAKSAGSAVMSSRPNKHQFFYCPNCKKSFSCIGQDSFDSWFEHVKNCNS